MRVVGVFLVIVKMFVNSRGMVKVNVVVNVSFLFIDLRCKVMLVFSS